MRYLFLFVLVSFCSLSLYSETYSITEEELTELENIIQEQEAELLNQKSFQKKLSENLTKQESIMKEQKTSILNLQNQLTEAQTEIQRQKKSLNQYEAGNLLNNLKYFLIGMLSGAVTLAISSYIIGI